MGSKASDTRARIVEAAAHVMRQKGIAQATTKEIARAAGCSEGTLYNYFESKQDLFLCALREQLPHFVSLVWAFPERAGRAMVRENLADLANAALAFYQQSIPMGASFFADPTLLDRHRALLRQRNVGPQKANEAVAAYLHAEQELGRVSRGHDPLFVADMLLGACFIRAYWNQFWGEEKEAAADARYVSGLLDMLMPILEP